MRARQVFGPRLANVHLSDVGGPLARLPVRRLRSAVGEHRFPGTGGLSLSTLLGDLGGDGYAGPVTLEVNPFALRFWWPAAVRRRLAEAAAWIKAAAGSEE
jgi:sugar phosphate isomerase/epimerase